MDQARLTALEQRTQNLAVRLQAVEALTLPAPTPAPAPAQPAAPAPATASTAWPAPTAPPSTAWPAPTAPALPLTPAPPSPDIPAAPAAPAAPARPRPTLEDLLGGRVLAWAGGLAVLVGIALLLAIAVSNGWIGEGARTLLAGTFALALVGGGAWLQERRRRSDAALAAVAAGVSGLFVTVAVGGPVYGVLPAGIAHALALAAGALAATLAVRWQSRGVGALGIVGALFAPVIAGAPAEASTLALLWLAGLSGVAVVVWQRWNWLSIAVFAIAAAQWLWWLGDSSPSDGAALVVLTVFGALNVGAAVGYELRVPTARLRISSAMLLTFNALVLALAGWWAFDGQALAQLWLVALAAVHLAVGMATRATRISRDLRLLSLTLGVILADVAAGTILDGPVLAGAWAVATAGFALLARSVVAHRKGEHDELLVGLGLGGHLLLSAAQALAQAPPEAVAAGDPITFGAQVAIAGTAAAAFVAGRFAADIRPQWRAALDSVAMAGVAYLSIITLDGAVLAAALAAQALALGTIAARRRDDVATCGAGAFLALALGHALAYEAPPIALVDGLESVPAALLALGAVVLVALRGARILPRYRIALDANAMAGVAYLLMLTLEGPVLAAALAAQALALGTIAARRHDDVAAYGAGAALALALGQALTFEAPPIALVDGLESILAATVALGAAALVALRGAQLLPRYRVALAATGAIALLYLASTAVVTLAADDLGQLLLSGLWATTGLAGLIVGLVRDERTLRLGSLALLGTTIAKVFLYDLAALESLYRVGSFIALGLLLLLAAGLWQRMRPRPLPDLRTAPPALR